MVSLASAGCISSSVIGSGTSQQSQEVLRTDAVVALRSATQALHEQLDRQLPLARAEASLADYAAHLTVLRDWQRSLAPWLARAIIDLAGLALLEQDLQDLRDCPAHAHAMPVLPTLAPPDLAALRQADDGRDGYCWGIAYVVEGSRLGGQVLYRRLAQQLAPHPLRYLGQRGNSGLSWPGMLACLRARLDTGLEVESACNGAAAAFELLLVRFAHAECLE
jgi:heme oxygenase